MQMTLQDRIQEIVFSGISPIKLAKAAGKTPAAVTFWLNGQTKSISGDAAAGIERATGYSAAWIATGRGPKMAATPRLPNVEEAQSSGGLVPLLSWVQAGQWCASGDALESHAAERWMHCPKPHSNQTFVLRVRGDSMTSTHGRSFPEGCYIFVDGAKRSPVNGECVVACLHHSQESTFKIYKDEDGRRWLQPLNAAHEPMREPFHVLGTVIGKWEDV